MRLLLLLSAFLTALTGVVAGAASAQPVQASTSLAQAKSGAAATIAETVPERMRRAYYVRSAPSARLIPLIYGNRTTFGERRRE